MLSIIPEEYTIGDNFTTGTVTTIMKSSPFLHDTLEYQEVEVGVDRVILQSLKVVFQAVDCDLGKAVS